MARKIAEAGGVLFCSAGARRILRTDSRFRVETDRLSLSCRKIVNCAGLYADKIARMMGLRPEARLIPFRGEYYSLSPGCRLVRALIYPVPNPEFPFLGVHFTRRIAGGYEAGPNAVLAFAREGYKFTDVSVKDLIDMVAFKGFWAMGWKYWRMEVYELYRSLSRRAFLRALQQLVPEIAGRRPGARGIGRACPDRHAGRIPGGRLFHCRGARRDQRFERAQSRRDRVHFDRQAHRKSIYD
jgi:L-2-hydroxyglutarate oxidase LhgO